MTRYVALLRAVNVGGTGKLPMAELKRMSEACRFQRVQTYIASGNLLFESDAAEAEVKAALEAALEAYAGKPVGVVVRTGAELAEVATRNPWPDAPGNRVAVIFLDQPPPADALEQARGRTTEQLALGRREIYVWYVDGQAVTKLVIPAAKAGTARNVNTVAKLAEMAG
jgi:uncharacterized protein (DUF1697 family)